MNFPVTDWEEIPLDTYKALLVEIKERFDITTTETISCTDKSIKCLIAFVTYVIGAGVFLLTNHYNINWESLILIAFAAYNVYLGYKIIRLRPSHTSGLLPENVLSKDFDLDTGFTQEEKEKLFYFNAIKTYTQKISEGTHDNCKRAEKYDTFFGFTLLLLLIITVFVFVTISYPPPVCKVLTGGIVLVVTFAIIIYYP